MLHATELLGGEAYDKDGHFVGHVTELFIEPADQPNRVARVLLGRGKYLPLVARYDRGRSRLIVRPCSKGSATPGRPSLTTPPRP